MKDDGVSNTVTNVDGSGDVADGGDAGTGDAGAGDGDAGVLVTVMQVLVMQVPAAATQYLVTTVRLSVISPQLRRFRQMVHLESQRRLLCLTLRLT